MLFSNTEARPHAEASNNRQPHEATRQSKLYPLPYDDKLMAECSLSIFSALLIDVMLAARNSPGRAMAEPSCDRCRCCRACNVSCLQRTRRNDIRCDGF